MQCAVKQELSFVSKFPITAMWRDPYQTAHAQCAQPMGSPWWCQSHYPREGSSQLSTWRALGEDHWHLPALLHCSGLCRFSPGSPQKDKRVLLCHPSVAGLKPTAWKWGEENKNILLKEQTLLAGEKKNISERKPHRLYYKVWTGREMLRVLEKKAPISEMRAVLCSQLWLVTTQ